MEHNRIRFGIEGRIAHIRLADARRMNLFDVPLCDELVAALDRIARERDVAAVMLTADGPNFTAGGDIAMFRGPADDVRERIDQAVRRVNDVVLRMRAIDAVIVAGVQGVAAGGGLGMLLASDIVVASDDAVFLPAHVALGAPADGGLSWFAPRLMGSRQALYWMLSNDRLSASDALMAGLVTKLVPRDRLAVEVTKIAERLARGPRQAQAMIKHLVNAATDVTLEHQLDAEHAAFVAVAGGAEFAAGVDAFVARRPASFVEPRP
jgi:2-(1,2-epoxy-1,2-dihydrophenyl)acetyl-CoA isomerase